MSHKTDFKIVCTDRGQHASRELRVLMVGVGNGGLSDPKELAKDWKQYEPAGSRNRGVGETITKSSSGAVGDENTPWRFHCVSCGRDVPMKHDRLGEFVMASVRAGIQALDISKLS